MIDTGFHVLIHNVELIHCFSYYDYFPANVVFQVLYYEEW